MASVLAVATSKGGTGKTTIAVALVDWWRRAGRKVGVLDTDPNQSITRWLGKGDDFKEVHVTPTANEHEIVNAVQTLSESVDLVIIDTAGFGNQAMIFAVGISDAVLIPVLADEASLFEAMKMRRMVESASALTRRQIPFRSVLNRARPTLVSRHTLKELTTHGLNPLKATVGDRTIFQEASYHGVSPATLDKRSKACLEIRKVARELDALLVAE